MDKSEYVELVAEYEEDFSSIQDVIDDASLTPSEKVSAIADIVEEGESSEEDFE